MRALPAAGFVAALALVFAASAMLLPANGVDAQGNIRVLSRLDEYTKASPRVANTVPTFLTQPGLLGQLPTSAPLAGGGPETPAPRVYTTNDIKPMNETELKKGFCTASLSRLIRQQFPGSYDDIPDEELEKTLLEKRPEYRDRLCMFPVWVDAAPSDIVKYEVEPASRLAKGGNQLLLAGLITAAIGAVGFVVYRRLG